ncbi:MAG: MdtA/MuxA family multidrug efflux RND transporter periplasmic adaptor subunit [Candidatus Acidiferrales bacterium]
MAATEEIKPGESGISAKQKSDQQAGPPKRHSWVWITLCVVLIAGLIAFNRARARSEAASGSPGGATPPSISVGVTTVQKKDVPYFLTGLGSVTAFNTVTVRSRVDGQLMKVNFTEGQFVHQGDLLAEIDPRPFQVALDQAQGQLAKDVAAQNDAKVNLARFQLLWQEGVIPRQQLDTQQAAVGQSEGAIQSDKATIDNAKLQLVYSRIIAPISGRVGLRLVDAGNMVHATDTNGMLVITQVQPISVIFALPEDNLPEVSAQMGKKVQLTVEAFSRDDKTKLADGKLQTIDNQIDQTTGTVKLKSIFDNHDLSLWPNQFVNIRLFLSMRRDANVIPSAAIQRGAQGTFVYVVKTDNKAEVRPVQVDFIEGNIAVIREGLTPGERVVVDGQDKLQSGTTVSFKPLGATQNPAPVAPQGQKQ